MVPGKAPWFDLDRQVFSVVGEEDDEIALGCELGAVAEAHRIQN